MRVPSLELHGILGGEKSLDAYLEFCGVSSLDELDALEDDQQLTLDVEAVVARAA